RPEPARELFDEGRPVFWDDIADDYPELLPLIQRHLREGDLEVVHHVRDQTRKKTERCVEPAAENKILQKEREALSNRAGKQKLLLDYFIEDAEPVSFKHLTELLNVTRSTVKSLVKKGLLAESDREVYRDPFEDRGFEKSEPLPLTEEQEKAMAPILRSIESRSHETILLHGVTGSGKTEIYLQSIDKVLRRGQEAIVLVPEISLTPQMVSRFKARFGSKVAVLHSGLSRGEKYDEWRKIQRREVNVVVGARSAVFAPFTKIGLIIIDEEHESSYKQEEQPRYHARDVAIKRGTVHGCPVVLGSATPSLESYARAKKDVYTLASLEERINQRALPGV
ncbi:MAG TPA: primosomal protein N', partial [Bacillales bacterium]|nr:primosomal protein N' [Bacillales bacterium]